jgi:hypothetical protein
LIEDYGDKLEGYLLLYSNNKNFGQNENEMYAVEKLFLNLNNVVK